MTLFQWVGHEVLHMNSVQHEGLAVHCSNAARHALPAEKRVIAREKWEEWSASVYNMKTWQ
jgi:hypothetical protein